MSDESDYMWLGEDGYVPRKRVVYFPVIEWEWSPSGLLTVGPYMDREAAIKFKGCIGVVRAVLEEGRFDD